MRKWCSSLTTFEDGDLAGWTIDDDGCGSSTHGWTVEEGVLVYRQGECDGCFAPLYVGDPGWSDYEITFDARVVVGDRVQVGYGFSVVGGGYRKLLIRRDAGETHLEVFDPFEEFIFGSSETDDLLDHWVRYGIENYGDFTGLSLDGVGDVGVRPVSAVSGGLVIEPVLSPGCDAVFEIDNVVIRKPLPSGTLGYWSWPTPYGDPLELKSFVQYATSATIQPGNHVVGPWLHKTVADPIFEPTLYTLHISNDVGSIELPFLALPGEPEVYDFSALPSTIVRGGSAELSWHTSYIDSLRIEPPGVTSRNSQGTIEVSPDVDTIYTMRTYFAGEEPGLHVQLVRVEPLAVVDWQADYDYVIPGAEVNLSWQVNAADSLVVEPIGFVGTGLNGSVPVFPLETTVYELTTYFAGESASEAVEVEIEPSRVRGFGLADPAIFPNGQTELQWNCSYGDSILVEPLGVLSTTMLGSVPVSPAGTTTYTIQLFHGGVETGNGEVELRVHDLAINDAGISQTEQAPGGPIETRWDVRPAAAEVYVGSSGPFGSVGSSIIYPTQSGVVEVRARIDGLEVGDDFPYAVVDPAPGQEKLLLVADPVSLEPFVASPVPGELFDIYAVAVNPAGFFSGMGFRLDLPPCAFISSVEYPVGFTSGLSSLPDIFGYYGSPNPCVAGPVEVLVTFTIAAFDFGDDDCINDVHWIRASEPTLPWSEPGLRVCGTEDWTPFGYVSPLRLGGGSEVPTALPEQPVRPQRDRLIGNLPNPFNPMTTIIYEVSGSGPVRLRIFDAAGRVVRTLNQKIEVPGRYEIPWNGTDDGGRPVGSGVYFARLETPDGFFTHKMALVR